MRIFKTKTRYKKANDYNFKSFFAFEIELDIKSFYFDIGVQQYCTNIDLFPGTERMSKYAVIVLNKNWDIGTEHLTYDGITYSSFSLGFLHFCWSF